VNTIIKRIRGMAKLKAYKRTLSSLIFSLQFCSAAYEDSKQARFIKRKRYSQYYHSTAMSARKVFETDYQGNGS